jgi:hypothetical protein
VLRLDVLRLGMVTVRTTRSRGCMPSPVGSNGTALRSGSLFSIKREIKLGKAHRISRVLRTEGFDESGEKVLKAFCQVLY